MDHLPLIRKCRSPVNFRRRPLKGQLLVILTVVTTTLVLGVVLVSRRRYPYSTYTGLPLSTYDHPYHINANTTCSSLPSINLIIVIHSKVTNFKKRTTIRNTWANKVLLSKFGFKIVFFLGLPFNKDLQSLAEEESSEFGDIVQGTFYDSYLNITHKAVLVLRWVTEYCSKAPVILKLDDDVFVNIFDLYHHSVPSLRTANKSIWCELKPPFSQKIHRWSGQRYQIADHEFKGFTYYPIPFCRGYFVLISQDSVTELYETAKVAPFFWIDDIYVYGILVRKTGVKLTQMINNLDSDSVNRAITCFRSRTEVCPLLGVLVSSPSVMETLWTLTVEQINWYHRKVKT